MSYDLDDNLKQFILDKFESVAQVEILCVLAHVGSKSWTVADLSRELRSIPSAVQTHLKSLMKIGLIVEKSGEYTYAPNSSDLDQKARALIRVYSERRVTVINLIYEKPAERIKTFADAFKIKRED